MSRKTQQIQLEIEKLQADCKAMLETAGFDEKDGHRVSKMDAAQTSDFREKQGRLEELRNEMIVAQYDEKSGVFGNAMPWGNSQDSPRRVKTIGEMLQSHPAWQGHIHKDGKGTVTDFSKHSTTFTFGEEDGLDLKSILHPSKAGFEDKTMTTTAGYPPFVTRTGQVVYLPEQVPTLVDFMPGGDTTQNSIKYITETVYTNSAVETAEAGTFPQSYLQYAEVVQAIQKIPTYIPVSDEQLEDVPELLAIIEARIGLMIRQAVQAHQINGTGIAPYLLGFLNATGLLTYASTGDNLVAIAGGIATVNSYGFGAANTARASAIVMNPTDYFKARTAKNTIGDFLMGPPNAAVAVPALWGLPVVEAADISAGTALVGDFQNFSMFWTRKQLTIEVGYSGNDFIQGQKTIRAEIRCSNQITRGSAFATVTGLV